MKRAVLAAIILGAPLLFLRRAPAPHNSSRAELAPPEPSRPSSSTSGRGLITSTPPAIPAAAAEPLVSHHDASAKSPDASRSLPTPREDVLDEILRSRNDNDPRLDSGFNGLSAETKKIFRLKYRRLPPENLNERGTIVYLLGKNLSAPEDWAFLRELVVESPCLSLADCSKEDSAAEAHGNPGSAVTLSYPALVALKQAQAVLENARSDDSSRREALEVVRAAKNSRSPIVVKAAHEAEP